MLKPHNSLIKIGKTHCFHRLLIEDSTRVYIIKLTG